MCLSQPSADWRLRPLVVLHEGTNSIRRSNTAVADVATEAVQNTEKGDAAMITVIVGADGKKKYIADGTVCDSLAEASKLLRDKR